MKGTIHPLFSYRQLRDRSRNHNVGDVRDVMANYEVFTTLLGQGYGRGEPILNHPGAPVHPDLDDGDDHELYPIDISSTRPGDILLSTTRPAKDDPKHGDRKQIQPARTDLERRIFDVWERYLERCPRSNVKLAPAMRRFLLPGFESRREITFKQTRGSAYKQLHDGRCRRRPANKMLTAAYLLHLAELPGGGPGLSNAFGMDAEVTLAWCYRLARDFSHLLAEPGFIVVEIETTPRLERPTNLRWAFDWKIETVLHARF